MKLQHHIFYRDVLYKDLLPTDKILIDRCIAAILESGLKSKVFKALNSQEDFKISIDSSITGKPEKALDMLILRVIKPLLDGRPFYVTHKDVFYQVEPVGDNVFYIHFPDGQVKKLALVHHLFILSPSDGNDDELARALSALVHQFINSR